MSCVFNWPNATSRSMKSEQDFRCDLARVVIALSWSAARYDPGRRPKTNLTGRLIRPWSSLTRCVEAATRRMIPIDSSESQLASWWPRSSCSSTLHLDEIIPAAPWDDGNDRLRCARISRLCLAFTADPRAPSTDTRIGRSQLGWKSMTDGCVTSGGCQRASDRSNKLC